MNSQNFLTFAKAAIVKAFTQKIIGQLNFGHTQMDLVKIAKESGIKGEEFADMLCEALEQAVPDVKKEVKKKIVWAFDKGLKDAKDVRS